jgi:hypothetical protein
MGKTTVGTFESVIESKKEEKKIDRKGLSLDKMTYLEKKFTLLSLARTIFIFFLVLYSVPFWIPTTYKVFLSEYEPFFKMFDGVTNSAIKL